jgi:hypothetical protein
MMGYIILMNGKENKGSKKMTKLTSKKIYAGCYEVTYRGAQWDVSKSENGGWNIARIRNGQIDFFSADWFATKADALDNIRLYNPQD